MGSSTLSFKEMEASYYVNDAFSNKVHVKQCKCKEEEGKCGSDCRNRLRKIECPISCGVKCTNQTISNRSFCNAIKIKNSEGKGRGIFATADIPANVFIREYTGMIYTEKDYDNLPTNYKYENDYTFRMNCGLIIDARRNGSKAKFVNHSCSANMEAQEWIKSGGHKTIVYVTSRKITKGEELTVNYNMDFKDNATKVCYCKSKFCKGTLGKSSTQNESDNLIFNLDSDNPETTFDDAVVYKYDSLLIPEIRIKRIQNVQELEENSEGTEPLSNVQPEPEINSGSAVASVKPIQKFQCLVCNRKFNRSYNLSVHERIHNGEKPFQCEICDKNFTRQWYLKEHIKTHTSERTPFKCTKCEKMFSTKSNLKKHENVHANLKPFKCSLCDSSFNEKAVLLQHETVHDKNKRYTCEICQKNYSQRATLWKHEQTHK